MKRVCLLISIIILFFSSEAQLVSTPLNLNQPERVEWFRNLGFGMFIHFSIDSQLGIVISHSMAGASDDYLNRYINELPQTFNPKDFDANEIATLAKLAGMKYIVFTAKHHSGFCMWDTQTTDFKITNTPYGKDLLAEYVEATRKAGLAVGIYYSPEDFHFLYKNGQQVRRRFTRPLPAHIMQKYLEENELQTIELMAKYGDIDILFFDGGEGPLVERCKQVAWELQPQVIVTRGAMKTPEQYIPGTINNDPWEANLTMGTQWSWKPTNENYKSGTRLIEILIETRAKGGNQLLNIGPKANGEIPEQQEALLREIAAWNFINHEAIENVRPWEVSHEGNIWYTWRPQEKTLYAFLTRQGEWPRGERREFLLKTVTSGTNTKIEVLGQSGQVVEYQPDNDATAYFSQEEDGLHVSCVRAQRIYNNHRWPNPIVLKITDVSPALKAPVIRTLGATSNVRGTTTTLQFTGEINSMGDTPILNAGFEYREDRSLIDDDESTQNWKQTLVTPVEEGKFSIEINIQEKGKTYQYRAFADHPKARVYGEIQKISF